MAEKTELVNIGGLFRNESKKGDVYYSGKSEDGTNYVLFRNAYWKEGENKPEDILRHAQEWVKNNQEKYDNWLEIARQAAN